MEEQEPPATKSEERLAAGGRDPPIIQVGTIGEFLTLEDPQQIKQEPDEGQEQCWSAQWQEFLETVESPQQGWEASKRPQSSSEVDAKEYQASFNSEMDSGLWPTGECRNHFPGSNETNETPDFSVKVKEEILDENIVSLEMDHQHFRRFCYQQDGGPQETLEPLGDVVVKSPKSEENPLEIVKLQIPLDIKQESDWEASSLECDEHVHKNDDDPFEVERPELEGISGISLGGAEGNFFWGPETEEKHGSEQEWHHGNYPASRTFLCEGSEQNSYDGTLQCRKQSFIGSEERWPHGVSVPENQQAPEHAFAALWHLQPTSALRCMSCRGIGPRSWLRRHERQPAHHLRGWLQTGGCVLLPLISTAGPGCRRGRHLLHQPGGSARLTVAHHTSIRPGVVAGDLHS
ncbi:UNVERIFIED_CONTAM: hypothetical protein K2H54_061332 [Gekko kuhli]